MIVLLAEIRNKLSENFIYRAKSSEDQLTGNLFGALRYLPFDKGLRQLLLQAKGHDKVLRALLEQEQLSEYEIKLWYKYGEVELDVLIETPTLTIGLEVKYNSELSGRNQLINEAQVLAQKLHPTKESLLLLLAPKAKAKRIYEQNYKREEMALQHFHFGYINLEDCYGPLKKLEKAENDKFRYLILKDLCDLLECKGFSVFNGFNNIPETEIDPGKYYTFNISHQNSARR